MSPTESKLLDLLGRALREHEQRCGVCNAYPRVWVRAGDFGEGRVNAWCEAHKPRGADAILFRDERQPTWVVDARIFINRLLVQDGGPTEDPSA